MKNLKAILFDLDGTIGNTLPLCIKAFKISIEPLIKNKLTDQQIIDTFGPSEEGTILALAPDHYELGLANYLRAYESLHDMCPSPFDGIVALLSAVKAKGVKIAMVTGKGPYSTEISLNQFNLKNYFEYVETGSPKGPSKPEGILKILNHWEDIHNEEIVYVGDSPSDIEASRAAGIGVVAVSWAETSNAERLLALKPDWHFSSVATFATWIDENVR